MVLKFTLRHGIRGTAIPGCVVSVAQTFLSVQIRRQQARGAQLSEQN